MGIGMTEDDDQIQVATLLASLPPPDVHADFVARVNARIDETAGWFGLADFRLWTLRLAPAVPALPPIAVLWPGGSFSSSSGSFSSSRTPAAARLSPASAHGWPHEGCAQARPAS